MECDWEYLSPDAKSTCAERSDTESASRFCPGWSRRHLKPAERRTCADRDAPETEKAAVDSVSWDGLNMTVGAAPAPAPMFSGAQTRYSLFKLTLPPSEEKEEEEEEEAKRLM